MLLGTSDLDQSCSTPTGEEANAAVLDFRPNRVGGADDNRGSTEKMDGTCKLLGGEHIDSVAGD